MADEGHFVHLAADAGFVHYLLTYWRALLPRGGKMAPAPTPPTTDVQSATYSFRLGHNTAEFFHWVWSMRRKLGCVPR